MNAGSEAAMNRRSYYQALSRIVGKRKIFWLRLKRHADTELFQQVQTLSSVDAHTLGECIAEQLEVPFLAEIPSFNPAVLPRGLSLRDMHRLCMIPILDGDCLRGVCGINRERIHHEYPFLSSLPFLFALPEHIYACLRLTEIAGAQDEQSNIQVVEAVLTRLLAFAQNATSNRIILLRYEDKMHYRLLRGEIAVSEGIICPRVGKELTAYCRGWVESGLSLLISGQRLSMRNSPVRGEICIDIEQMIGLENSGNCCPAREIISLPSVPGSREILVVEDRRDFLRVLERFLQRAGFQVQTAANGAEAMKILLCKKSLPAALVTDLHMPVSDGFSLAEQARKLGPLPILFLTSDDSIESELNAIDRGGVAVIQKARDPRILVAHLNRICGVQEREAA